MPKIICDSDSDDLVLSDDDKTVMDNGLAQQLNISPCKELGFALYEENQIINKFQTLEEIEKEIVESAINSKHLLNSLFLELKQYFLASTYFTEKNKTNIKNRIIGKIQARILDETKYMSIQKTIEDFFR